MDTQLVNAGDSTKSSGEAGSTIGLLITNATNRRLLIDFLHQAGYEVRGSPPSDVALDDWADISLMITDERAARQYKSRILALRHQAGGYFLPLLITLTQKSESTVWLKAGFDDVLRLPLRKGELVARLRVYLRLREQSEESRRLTRQVVLAQEAERQRLARELHDEIGQALTAVNLNLQALQVGTADTTISARLQDSLNIVEYTLGQVRDLSLDLHPSILDDLGLVDALKWYLDRQAERTGLVIELRAKLPHADLPAEMKSTCFRVTQEAITNIVRHANAKKVRVELRQGKTELELSIRDNGAGFEVEPARQRARLGTSLGLLGMQERVALVGGQLQIKSAPGAGTEIRAHFPLRAAPAQQAGGKHAKARRGAR